MILTHKQLQYFRNLNGHLPCAIQLDIFKKVFPNGIMEINKESLSKCENLDVPRFLEEFAPNNLRKEILRHKNEFYFEQEIPILDYHELSYTIYRNEQIFFYLTVHKWPEISDVIVTEKFVQNCNKITLEYSYPSESVELTYSDDTKYYQKLERFLLRRPSSRELNTIRSLKNLKTLKTEFFSPDRDLWTLLEYYKVLKK